MDIKLTSSTPTFRRRLISLITFAAVRAADSRSILVFSATFLEWITSYLFFWGTSRHHRIVKIAQFQQSSNWLILPIICRVERNPEMRSLSESIWPFNSLYKNDNSVSVLLCDRECISNSINRSWSGLTIPIHAAHTEETTSGRILLWSFELLCRGTKLH